MSIHITSIGWSSWGTTSPWGSTTEVQFNDWWSFAWDSAFVYDKINDRVWLWTTPAVKLDISSKAWEWECMFRMRHLEDNWTEFKVYQDANNATFETDKPFQSINGTLASPQSNKIYGAHFEKYVPNTWATAWDLALKIHSDGAVEIPKQTNAYVDAYGDDAVVTKGYIDAHYIAFN